MYLTFYSKKSQQQEYIWMEATEHGWKMDHPCYQGAVTPDGHPHLLRCLQENYAEYPSAFGDALEELWTAVNGNSLSKTEIQDRLNAFSSWIMHYGITKQPTLVY